MSRFAVAGVLEGFYGPPWSWDDRYGVMERCVPGGLPWYVWAPKSDPLHRAKWREPFTQEHLDGFARLRTIDGLHLGVAISPGVDLTDDIASEAKALADKLQPVLNLGADLIMIAFDDLRFDADIASHGQLVSALYELLDLDDVYVVVVPTHYATTGGTEYLSALASYLPPEVMIGWTGESVVNDVVLASEAESFSDAVQGLPLALWDNYPVNDALMSDRLFMLPLTGRDPLLDEFCSAYFANAGVQAWPSLPALLSAGAWVTTGHAEIDWDEFESPPALAILSQACDGRELYRLGQLAVNEDDTDDLWWWMERLENLDVLGPIGEQAQPWIEQCKAEAEVCLLALDMLERDTDDEEIGALIIQLWRSWPRVRRSAHTVFGPRFSLQPTLGIDAAGHWRLNETGLTENQNVTDLLCRAALHKHARSRT